MKLRTLLLAGLISFTPMLVHAQCAVPGQCGNGIDVQQSGSDVVNPASVLNFVGATVSGSGNTATITITGGGGGVTSWNTRTGAVTFTNSDLTAVLTSADIIAVLGYTPDNPTASAISGGTINGATIGATTPSSVAATTLSASGAVSGAGFTSLLAPYLTSSIAASTYVPINGAGGTPTSLTLTNATGLPGATGITGTVPVVNGGTGTTTSTGTGSVMLSASPTSTGTFTAGTVTALGLTVNGGHVVSLPTAATVATGFGTGDAITHSNGSWAWTDTVGTSPSTTATFTMPSANYGWECNARDSTTPGIVIRQTGAPVTTSVTFTSYSITTGVASAPTAADVIQIGPCAGH